MTKPRIGAVSYLNTKPLVEGLGELAIGYEIAFDLPSRLADDLQRGDYQVALIPSIEVIQSRASDRDTYAIVSDACIGCRGPVWSVKLMSKVEPNRIASLALDEGSRTSCALARIILKHKYGVEPECSPLRIDQPWQEIGTDAVLIIGDRAMKASDNRYPVELDLGEVWNDWTGMPFVFAVWTARELEGADLASLSHILSAARDRGLANLEAISRVQAGKYGLSPTECSNYLRNNLHFRLGDEEKAGLQLFYEYAAEMSLIDKQFDPQYHPATV